MTIAAVARDAQVDPADVSILRGLTRALRALSDHLSKSGASLDGLTPTHDAPTTAMVAEIRSLIDRYSSGANRWVDFLERVEGTYAPKPPESEVALGRRLHAFLQVATETSSIGLLRIAIYRFAEGRQRISSEAVGLVRQIELYIPSLLERDRRDRECRQNRHAFIDELYKRPETIDLMRAYDALEKLTGRAFNVETIENTSPSVEAGLIAALKLVILWCRKNRRPFTFDHLPLGTENPHHDFRAMRREWKASRSS